MTEAIWPRDVVEFRISGIAHFMVAIAARRSGEDVATKVNLLTMAYTEQDGTREDHDRTRALDHEEGLLGR